MLAITRELRSTVDSCIESGDILSSGRLICTLVPKISRWLVIIIVTAVLSVTLLIATGVCRT